MIFVSDAKQFFSRLGPNFSLGRRRRREPPPALERTSAALRKVAAGILQIPERKAQAFLSAGVRVAAGSAASGTAVGLVSLFGTASTGTAIGSLFGAAKGTATLYWIGGIVGGGVAAGGAVLAVGALGFGWLAAWKARRAVFGKARSQEALNETEQRLLAAIVTLRAAIEATEGRESAAPPSRAELAAFARIGLASLTDALDAAKADGMFASLAPWPARRLASGTRELRALAREIGT